MKIDIDQLISKKSHQGDSLDFVDVKAIQDIIVLLETCIGEKCAKENKSKCHYLIALKQYESKDVINSIDNLEKCIRTDEDFDMVSI